MYKTNSYHGNALFWGLICNPRFFQATRSQKIIEGLQSSQTDYYYCLGWWTYPHKHNAMSASVDLFCQVTLTKVLNNGNKLRSMFSYLIEKISSIFFVCLASHLERPTPLCPPWQRYFLAYRATATRNFSTSQTLFGILFFFFFVLLRNWCLCSALEAVNV